MVVVVVLGLGVVVAELQLKTWSLDRDWGVVYFISHIIHFIDFLPAVLGLSCASLIINFAAAFVIVFTESPRHSLLVFSPVEIESPLCCGANAGSSLPNGLSAY